MKNGKKIFRCFFADHWYSTGYSFGYHWFESLVQYHILQVALYFSAKKHSNDIWYYSCPVISLWQKDMLDLWKTVTPCELKDVLKSLSIFFNDLDHTKNLCLSSSDTKKMSFCYERSNKTAFFQMVQSSCCFHKIFTSFFHLTKKEQDLSKILAHLKILEGVLKRSFLFLLLNISFNFYSFPKF